MTIGEALVRVDDLKPNAYDRSRKLDWLHEVEGMVHCDVLSHYEDCAGLPCWGRRVSDETELAVPAPWDALYIHFLESRIDYANGEYDKYNNANAMFSAVLKGFRNHWNRTHTHERSGIGWW